MVFLFQINSYSQILSDEVCENFAENLNLTRKTNETLNAKIISIISNQYKNEKNETLSLFEYEKILETLCLHKNYLDKILENLYSYALFYKKSNLLPENYYVKVIGMNYDDAKVIYEYSKKLYSKVEGVTNNLKTIVTDTLADSRDGKTYKTVKIGNQVWMAENLQYKADNGCWAYNNNESNAKKYGYLYNWETAKKACPKGWHLPSDKEWDSLTIYLGGKNLAGSKLKSATVWDGNNESGFTALPAGYLNDVSFFYLGKGSGFWSATEVDSTSAFYRPLPSGNILLKLSYDPKTFGFSVRCIKDN